MSYSHTPERSLGASCCPSFDGEVLRASYAVGLPSNKHGSAVSYKDVQVKQQDVILVVTGMLDSSDNEFADHLLIHGESVKDIAFTVVCKQPQPLVSWTMLRGYHHPLISLFLAE
jgi:hypothetical protein